MVKFGQAIVQGTYMSAALGIDVGAVSLKAALLLSRGDAAGAAQRAPADAGFRTLHFANHDDLAALLAPPRRTHGRPLEVARELFAELQALLPEGTETKLILTGSGASLVAGPLEATTCNDFQAYARAIDRLHPNVRTVFELGGETSRYIRLLPDPASGTLGILDYSNNGDCAAGTGAFLDQQAGRLNYDIKDIGEIVAEASRAAQIAGRCSVFAKSDMIHAQQKGFAPPEVLRGLCHAVAANFKSAVVKGRPIESPVAFVGGVSANSAVVAELRDVFELSEDELMIPRRRIRWAPLVRHCWRSTRTLRRAARLAINWPCSTKPRTATAMRFRPRGRSRLSAYNCCAIAKSRTASRARRRSMPISGWTSAPSAPSSC